LSGC